MLKNEVRRICAAVFESTSSINRRMYTGCLPGQALNEFWLLQDHVGRLIEVAVDDPNDVFPFIEGEYAAMIPNLYEALDVAASLHFENSSAEGRACNKIRRSLILLQHQPKYRKAAMRFDVTQPAAQ